MQGRLGTISISMNERLYDDNLYSIELNEPIPSRSEVRCSFSRFQLRAVIMRKLLMICFVLFKLFVALR